MDKQVKAYYNIASDYHIAANSLLSNIVDAPYLYSPILYLLRHTIELQLKGLILVESKKDAVHVNISAIKMPTGRRMDSTHSIKELWDYYKQLYELHNSSVHLSEFQTFNKVLSRLDKKDCLSTRYRYPSAKDGSLINYEPVKIRYSQISHDIGSGIPTVVKSETSIGIIDNGPQLIREAFEIREAIEFLFSMYKCKNCNHTHHHQVM